MGLKKLETITCLCVEQEEIGVEEVRGSQGSSSGYYGVQVPVDSKTCHVLSRTAVTNDLAKERRKTK